MHLKKRREKRIDNEHDQRTMNNNMKEKERIRLESEIFGFLNRDNYRRNTFHFSWQEDTESVSCSVLSCNPITGQVFLLHSESGDSHQKALEKILESLRESSSEEYSWKVVWVDKLSKAHVSYFRGRNEEEVRSKFYYDDTDNNAILSVERMPLS